MIYVKFKKLTKTAQVPTKGSAGAAGYDLYADTMRDIIVLPGETVPFYTGIAMEIPHGYAGFVQSRSGTATKKGLRIAMGTGIIDSDYRGNIGIPLHNDSDEVQIVEPHERIAQILIQPVADVQLYETPGDLSWTQRGEAGFGSTGK
jgi:dUTP pyrophosphatase